MVVTQRVRAGFTLVEIMIAISIMAVMAVVVGPQVVSYYERANRSTAYSTLRALKQGVESFHQDTDEYPATLTDLVKEPTEERFLKTWPKGGYLSAKKVPKDPWGASYQYNLTPGAEHPFELFSYGPDGKKGSAAKRLSVWDEKQK